MKLKIGIDALPFKILFKVLVRCPSQTYFFRVEFPAICNSRNFSLNTILIEKSDKIQITTSTQLSAGQL